MRKSRGVNTYSGAHANTSRIRGRAAGYACSQCGCQANEWALRHDAKPLLFDERGLAFSVSPGDYMPMCRRCHRIYDKAHITHCPEGHPYAGENLFHDAGKRKCRECVNARNRARQKSRELTPEQRARRNEYQRRWRADRKEAT